ncbi:glycine receptor subunit alpha-3-like [Penaeus indicus]|uniref:glycine receptor subunit alpha-3-like n=1 Tax=Penaeus indicus TaxID=29960 RepID=UPI00300C3514
MQFSLHSKQKVQSMYRACKVHCMLPVYYVLHDHVSTVVTFYMTTYPQLLRSTRPRIHSYYVLHDHVSTVVTFYTTTCYVLHDHVSTVVTFYMTTHPHRHTARPPLLPGCLCLACPLYSAYHTPVLLNIEPATTLTLKNQTSSTTTEEHELTTHHYTGDQLSEHLQPTKKGNEGESPSLTGRTLRIEDIMPDDPTTYDKMRPPKQGGRPTNVHFHVTVMSIDSINENSMTFAADIFFAQTWTDHRLKLPANMTTEYRLLDLDWLEHLWRPDSFFKNAKEVNFQTMTIPNHYVWLYKDFSILYMVKLTLTLSCAMNFAIYPHDTQECKLQMESLSHTTDDLVFQWDRSVPLVVDEHIELPQQMIVSNTTSDCTQVYSTGNFTCLEIVFRLKRRLGHYLFHTYIPTCLIVIMSVSRLVE